MKIFKIATRAIIAIALVGISRFQLLRYGETHFFEDTFLSIVLGSILVIVTVDTPQKKSLAKEVQEFLLLFFDFIVVFIIAGIIFKVPISILIELLVGQIMTIFLTRYALEELKGIRIVFALSLLMVGMMIVAYTGLGSQYNILVSLIFWSFMYFVYKYLDNDIA
ncbi:MAG: hypothetical protein A2Y23_04870 [Clostridiales bacterium GWB2_37_7]|nr:MAG: hypothetical protein A2Y23_04870 [Clostridiales bacterium GWB2_37_7]